MTSLFQSVRNVDSAQDILRTRAYGVIEVARGELVQIQLKPWPKIGSVVEAKWISGWKNRRQPHDVCRLYYNQPIQHRNYLALTFIESTPNTRLRTLFRSLQILDQIAFLKRSDAILAEISNEKISDRLMERFGWQRHLERKRQRHWIKRFYGEYPPTLLQTASKMTQS